MVARKSGSSLAIAAVLAAVVSLVASLPCHAQDPTAPTGGAPIPPAEGPLPGRGGIGGQIGSGSVVGEGDYSAGAATRFSFSGHWRYVMASWIRWQISPGLFWAGYDEKEPAPFRDLNFPDDSTKSEYLTLMVPVSAQIQLTMRRGEWLYYLGAGPGAYQVWVENRRKVLKDPASFKLHSGIYPGASFQIGAERFLKGLPSTSIEVSLDGHYVLAEDDEKFPSGWNNTLTAIGFRVGGNYYFGLDRGRKPDAGVPEGPPGP